MASALSRRSHAHLLRHPGALARRVFSHSALLQYARPDSIARRNRNTTTSSSSSSSGSSSGSDQKPIVLEQPSAFRPPSHPSRLRTRRPRMTYGREITDEDREEMESKSYPYAMPGRNTFMYKLMHARYFHAFFAISVLTSLAIYVFALDLHAHNRYPELVPAAATFYQHPLTFFSQYYSVWRLNQAAADQEHRERRDRAAQDVEGRRRYREKHDLPEVTGLTQWLGLGTKEEEERLARKRAAREQQQQQQESETGVRVGEHAAVAMDGDVQQSAAVAGAGPGQDEGGEQGARPKRKVFLGIWGW